MNGSDTRALRWLPAELVEDRTSLGFSPSEPAELRGKKDSALSRPAMVNSLSRAACASFTRPEPRTPHHME